MSCVPSISFLLLATLVVGLATVNCQKLDCTRPNEEYQCGSACQTTCKDLGKACPIVNIKCNDACYCKNGFARDDEGVCIPISKCSS